MKKKYPKDWTNVVFKYMESWKTYTVNRGRFLTFAESEAIAFLDYMDAAGMLAPIPEPLEIEYCVVHGYVGKRHDGNCVDMKLYPFSENRCNFKKMREVEE